ncbi:hypothetical protein EDC94DRAFT_604859 [Helicostylum pulchrum]|nr:hypothetical protein EDC94DRAFT_604859 [Helicostylum pulchrum]
MLRDFIVLCSWFLHAPSSYPHPSRFILCLGTLHRALGGDGSRCCSYDPTQHSTGCCPCWGRKTCIRYLLLKVKEYC